VIMEVIVIDGEPRPCPEVHIQNRASSDGTSEIAGIRVFESHPVTASLTTTRVMDTPAELERVHISSDDMLYELTDVFVSSSNSTVGELYGEMELTANTMSARTLTTRLK